MNRIRSRMTFANVVSVIALFVALGGTAAAAVVITSNSQVGPGTISGHEPPSGKQANIIGGSINGFDVADNRLTGADVHEATLGKVPAAERLDGIDSSGFIHGGGRIVTIDEVIPSFSDLVDLPGFVELQGVCQGLTNPGSVQLTTHSQPITALSDNGAANLAVHEINPNTLISSSDWRLDPPADYLTFSLESPGGRVATAFIFSRAFHDAALNQDVCRFTGHVIVRGG
jgi:hypothetical protein